MPKANKSFSIPRVIESGMIFEESLVKIRRDRLQIDNESPYTYYTLMTPPFAVAVLASTDEGELIINQEYRHPTGKIIFGCPGGYIDPGENPLQAAQRELLEETGYQANDFKIIGSVYPYTGFSGQKTIFISATGAKLSAQAKLEVSEIIQPMPIKPQDLIQKINDGVEVDGILCTALFFKQNFRD